MKKLNLDGLTVDSFATDPTVRDARGSVAAHRAAPGTVLGCPYSYGGTCVISGCLPCYTDDPCG